MGSMLRFLTDVLQTPAEPSRDVGSLECGGALSDSW